MKDHLSQYMRFLRQLVSWRFLPFYMTAVASTFWLVQSGIDWKYIVWVYEQNLTFLLYSGDLLGFVIAIFLPLSLYVIGHYSQRHLYVIYATAVTYCVVLGFTVSTFIKMFTGRTSPPHRHRGEELILIDNSQAFNFGFMREQIIGGWPSSHTTIMFALATCLWMMLPIRWWYKLPVLLIALYVGIGVTFGFHWLSEFVAGVCLGIAIGYIVGQFYGKKMSSAN